MKDNGPTLEGGNLAYLDGTRSDFFGKAAARPGTSKQLQDGQGKATPGGMKERDFRNRRKANENVRGLYGVLGSLFLHRGLGRGASPSSAGTS